MLNLLPNPLAPEPGKITQKKKLGCITLVVAQPGLRWLKNLGCITLIVGKPGVGWLRVAEPVGPQRKTGCITPVDGRLKEQ